MSGTPIATPSECRSLKDYIDWLWGLSEINSYRVLCEDELDAHRLWMMLSSRAIKDFTVTIIESERRIIKRSGISIQILEDAPKGTK